LGKPIRGGKSHYLGFSVDVKKRIAQHRAGVGAHILRDANKQDISWRVVRLWRGTLNSEEKFKKYGNYRLLCPICNPTGYRIFSDSSQSSEKVLTLEKT
jgi:hypothetical protein